MLQLLYTGTYRNEIPIEIDIEGIVSTIPAFVYLAYEFSDDDELLKDSRVYFLADEFFLHDLKDLALKRFQNKIDQLWATNGLTACLQEVYANTLKKEEEIRVAAMRTVCTHVNDLLSMSSFRLLVAEGGDLAVELVEALSITKSATAPKEYWDFSGT